MTRPPYSREPADSDRAQPITPTLGLWDAASIIVGIVVGTAIFKTPRMVFLNVTGPWQALGVWLMGGLLSLIGSLCYAELAAMMPIAGSTYSYAYAAFGTFLAWFIGWDLLLEYLFAASTVAVSWSAYFVDLLGSVGIHFPHDLANPPFGDDPGIVNLPALAVMAAVEWRTGDLLANQGPWLRGMLVISGLFAIVGAVTIFRFPTTENARAAARIAFKHRQAFSPMPRPAQQAGWCRTSLADSSSRDGATRAPDRW
mgnify:CR=1 FL=1